MKIKSHQSFTIISVFFALIYVALSIVPHFNFQTNAFDLGIFNQAIQQYAHLEIGPNTVREVPTLFADHFEILPLILSPLYWLFGSYTLLLVQILSTILGALGIFLLVKKETKDPKLALGAITIFYLFFGLITALAFDYHNNTVGTMLIPWLFYLISIRKFYAYYGILALFLLCKENLALISAFLGISLIFFEDKKIKKHGLITLIASILYFVVILKVIAYLNGGIYDHWPYSALGDGPLDAIKNIFLHPIEITSLLFDQPEKIKSWILILASGGALAIFKPKYSILIVPIIAQKFFADAPAFWGYTFHYTVELAPIIAIGSILAIHKFKKLKYTAVIALILVNIGILSAATLYNGDNFTKIFTTDHYRTTYDKKDLKTAIALIPTNSSVSAQNTIVPHLKTKTIYQLPKINNAEFIIINLNDSNIWPISNQETLKTIVRNLQTNPSYKEAFESNGIHLFEHQSP